MFKKILYTFLLIVLPISAQPHISGNGTSGNPYILYNAADFDSMRYLGFNKYYELGNDIDFSNFGPFTKFPYIQNGERFHFDGRGYKIYGMRLTGSLGGAYSGYVSIFPYFSTGKTFTFKNVVFEKDSIVYDQSAGSLGPTSFSFIANFHTSSEKFEIENIIFKDCIIDLKEKGSGRGLIGLAVTHIDKRDTIRNILVDACTVKVYASGWNAGSAFMIGGVLSSIDAGFYYTPLAERLFVKDSYFSYINYDNASNGARIFIGGIVGTIASGTLKDAGSINNTFVGYISSSLGGWVGGIEAVSGNSDWNKGNLYRIYTANNAYSVTNAPKGAVIGKLSGFSETTNVDSSYYETGAVDSVGVVNGTNRGKRVWNVRTAEQMKDKDTYVDWDFDDVWGISEYYQGGYPFLLGSIYLILQTPVKDQFVLTPSPVVISWVGEGGSNPEVEIYYSLDGGVHYTYITNSTSPYNWTTYPEVNSTTTRIKLVLNGYSIESNNFTIINSPTITILSPIDSTGIGSVDSSITIKFESSFLTKVFLAYSDNNAGPWSSVVEIPIDTINGSYLDTTSYVWSLPNIQGELWLMISEIADTTIYGFNQPLTLVGRQLNSNAGVICWSHVTGNWIVNYNCLDIACGWTSYAKSQWTTLLNDYGIGFDYYKGTSNNSCDLDYFYKPNPVTIDGNNVSIQSFYGNESSIITYKGREYYIDVPTKTVRMNDLYNGISNIFVADLSPFCDIYSGGYYYGWSGCPTRLQLYNVQRSKIEGHSFTTPQDFESLNDPDFVPKILIIGSAYGFGGDLVYSMETLEFPNPLDPVYDTARIFEDLSIRRTLFRGIDPKANKVKR